MNNNCPITKFFVFLFVFTTSYFINNTYALSLTKIGMLNTSSNTYPEWWYTGTNPTLYGTAAAGSKVNIKVDTKDYTVTADSSGNWSHNIGTYNIGDTVDISITGDGTTYNFVLNLGQSVPSDLNKGGGAKEVTMSSVPDTGSNHLIALTIFAGLTCFSFFQLTKDNKKAFERKLTNN